MEHEKNNNDNSDFFLMITMSMLLTSYTVYADDDEKQAKSRRMFSSMIAMLGLVLSIYSILLLATFYFDKSNVFIDLSLVSFLTFGKLRIEDDDFHYRGTTEGVRHMSSKDFHIFVFLLLGFSIAWTAGLIQQVVIFILDKIMSFF